MEKKNEIDTLDELNKGACMGEDAIHFILDKVKDIDLKNLLAKEYQKYQNIIDRIAQLYPDYSPKEPHETNIMNKAMTWYGIEIKTLTDSSTSKLSELLFQGTNMGIIEGRKLLNHKDTNKEVHDLVEKYITMQEEFVEELKKFL